MEEGEVTGEGSAGSQGRQRKALTTPLGLRPRSPPGPQGGGPGDRAGPRRDKETYSLFGVVWKSSNCRTRLQRGLWTAQEEGSGRGSPKHHRGGGQCEKPVGFLFSVVSEESVFTEHSLSSSLLIKASPQLPNTGPPPACSLHWLPTSSPHAIVKVLPYPVLIYHPSLNPHVSHRLPASNLQACVHTAPLGMNATSLLRILPHHPICPAQ